MPESPRYALSAVILVHANRAFEGGSLVVIAWMKPNPPWPERDKYELTIRTRTTFSNVRSRVSEKVLKKKGKFEPGGLLVSIPGGKSCIGHY
jgi:hypothetical protein